MAIQYFKNDEWQSSSSGRFSNNVYPSGVYFSQDKLPGGVANVGTANRMKAVAWYFHKPIRLDRIGIVLNDGGGAGKLANAGIYTIEDGIPSNLIVETGDLACDTNGEKIGVVDVSLTSGWYAFALSMNDASARFRMNLRQYPALGFVAGQALNNNLERWTGTRASWGPFPSVFPSPTLEGNGRYFFFVRQA